MQPEARTRGTVYAVLGPTNTGKTHYAVERMLGRRSGVIGFPLRLLAREVYDRIVARIGAREVALITGEEKIAPASARYAVCTVESMPLDWNPAFLAVDEIQLAADSERGHVFTDRLLNARGTEETLFLGSQSIRDRMAALNPHTVFLGRERMSQLTYCGSKKIGRLPPRSAIVAFSTEAVYAIAELIRRQKGGAAVVMGSLSPRTRNAQVALFQNGDVDYLVATDAIGMGLNLDLNYVFFAGASKFDGRRHRALTHQELAQIAGRAGRHTNDGQFGATGEVAGLDPEAVEAVENHRFERVRQLLWRNSDLDFSSPDALLHSLEAPPPAPGLIRAGESEDMTVLRLLSRDPDVRDTAKGRAGVRLLWDVCQIPDFRKTLASEHSALLGRIYSFLASDAGVIPSHWIAAQLQRIDRTDGDIDALSKRLAYVRTWTYVANRAKWLDDPAAWREKTRALEDRLSDALHERLTQRFVDRRTSVLMRRLKQKEELMATVEQDGTVTVEGEFVGRIEGLRFQPDRSGEEAHEKTLRQASTGPVQAELVRRVEKLYADPDTAIDFTEQGGIVWDNVVIGRLVKGADALSPQATLFADDLLEAPSVERATRRMQQWIDRRIATLFEPIFAMRGDEALEGLARGVAYQLGEALGVIPRPKIANDIKALEQGARSALRKHGVRFGQHTVFVAALLKPAPTRLRVALWGLAEALEEIPSPPPPGLVTIPAVEGAPEAYYPMSGYRLAGARAIRIDMLERLADLLRPLDARAGFEATADMLSITGLTLEQFADLMGGLGFAHERAERPKVKAAPVSAPVVAAAPEGEAEESEVPAEAADAESPVPEADAPASVDAAPAEAIAPTDEAAPTEAAAPDESAASEPVAMEEYVTFRLAPRPRRPEHSRPRRRDDQRPQADRPQGARRQDDGAQGDKPREARPQGERNQAERGRRNDGKPHDRPKRADGEGRPPRNADGADKHPRGDRPQGGKGRPPRRDDRADKPREFVAAPPKSQKAVDPDSPFAILQQLKSK